MTGADYGETVFQDTVLVNKLYELLQKKIEFQSVSKGGVTVSGGEIGGGGGSRGGGEIAG